MLPPRTRGLQSSQPGSSRRFLRTWTNSSHLKTMKRWTTQLPHRFPNCPYRFLQVLLHGLWSGHPEDPNLLQKWVSGARHDCIRGGIEQASRDFLAPVTFLPTEPSLGERTVSSKLRDSGPLHCSHTHSFSTNLALKKTLCMDDLNH